MRRAGLLLCVLLSVTISGYAQGTGYTNVIATIPSYAGGSVSAGFVPNPNVSGQYTLGGSSFPMTNSAGISASGAFSFYLADNTIVTPNQPAPSQWKITVCAKPGNTPPCNAATLTISGATQDVSSRFPAASPTTAYQLVEQAGTPFTPRLNLNFAANTTCTDNPANNSTDCTPGGITPAGSGQVQASNAAGNALQVATPAQVSTAAGGNPGTFFAADSIGAGTGSSPTPSSTQGNVNGYAPQVANTIGGPYFNLAVAGDQCADQAKNVVFATLNPQGNYQDPVLYLGLGTNDITRYTSNANQQQIFQICELGINSWGSIPFANKKFGQNGTLAGGFAADTTVTQLQSGLGAVCTTNGCTATYTITTPIANGPLYFWYLIKDTNGGTFTVSVDGTLQNEPCSGTTTWTAAGCGGALISTQNATTQTVVGARLPTTGAANSSHTLLVTGTSATSASNIIEVYGVGTPALPSPSNPAVVDISPNPQNNANTALVPTYSTFVSNQVATTAADGLNVTFADTGSALLNIATAVTLPYTLTNTTQVIPGWTSDNCSTIGSPGCVSYSGQPSTPLTLVASSPAAGQYSVSAGTYTINAADENRPLLISANINCGSNSVTTLAANCMVDTIHPNAAGHGVMRTVIVAATPAGHKNGALTSYRPAPLVTSANSLTPTNPTQFWTPNPYNVGGAGWNPGINLITLNGAAYGVTYEPTTGITTYFPNNGSAPAASWCPTVGGNGKQAPGAPPLAATCYISIAANGSITIIVPVTVPRLVLNGAGYSGTIVLPTAAIAGGACSTVAQYAIGGSQISTTSTVTWAPNADPTAVTGYGAGGLTIWVWPSAAAVNAKACNSTALSITPGALTLNVKAIL